MFNKKILLVLAAALCITGCSSAKELSGAGTQTLQNTAVELKDDMGALTISKSGSYVISGSTDNGSIIVDAGDDDEITLILDNAEINAQATAALYVKNAGTVTVVLDENTINTLTATGDFEADGDIKVDGVIFSKADLVLEGGGALNIDCETAHGIVSKDSLLINDGNYTISATKKGLSVNDDITINGGVISIDSEDDTIHSNANVVINDGTFTLNSGDDGIHADGEVSVNAGTIDIAECYEGIEGEVVTINDGIISIAASDDGINAAGGSESGEKGGMMNSDSDAYIYINGGTITIDADGDGIDSNGSLYVSGGNVYINGTENNGDGSLDYDIDAQITGGTVIATGMSGMAQNFAQGSTQCSALINLSTVMDAGTQIKLMDSSGNVLIDYTAVKKYNSVVISCPDMKTGESYTLVTGDVTTEFEMTDVIYGNGMQGGPGNFGDFKNGDRPQLPDGETPQLPDGEAPQLPDGETPQPPQDMKNGDGQNMPGMPGKEAPAKK